MDDSELESVFKQWKKARTRTAWVPVKGVSDGTSKSWFGGRPCLEEGVAWPTCAGCAKPMSFMLQLNLAELPSDFNARHSTGLMQFFYCSSDDGSCETWDPFSGTHAFCVSACESPVASYPESIEPLPEVAIAKWSGISDSPDPEEHAEHGLVYEYDFENRLMDVSCAEYSIKLKGIEIGASERISVAAAGDKLGGWPHWIQGVEYPDCPECSARMELFMQIDSEDNLAYMFGDVGCAHIFQCATHPTVFGFGWACG